MTSNPSESPPHVHLFAPTLTTLDAYSLILLEPRGCGLQASLKSGLDDFASRAFIAPTIRIKGVRPTINRVIDPSRNAP